VVRAEGLKRGRAKFEPFRGEEVFSLTDYTDTHRHFFCELQKIFW
jgi:hypothetical protein